MIIRACIAIFHKSHRRRNTLKQDLGLYPPSSVCSPHKSVVRLMRALGKNLSRPSPQETDRETSSGPLSQKRARELEMAGPLKIGNAPGG